MIDHNQFIFTPFHLTFIIIIIMQRTKQEFEEYLQGLLTSFAPSSGNGMWDQASLIELFDAVRLTEFDELALEEAYHDCTRDDFKGITQD
jgi:hypothetical protein